MHLLSSMRRYKYRDTLDRHGLMAVMRARGLTVNQLSRIACIGSQRVDRVLKGEPGHEVPPYLDQLVRLWDEVPGAYEASLAWANRHAYDAREGGDDA